MDIPDTFFQDPQELTRLLQKANRLVTLAMLGARCRSTVVRDTYKRDTIDLVPGPERPPRLFAQLRQLHAGMLAIGTPPEEVWRLLADVGLGGIHRDRRRIVEVLVDTVMNMTISTIGGRVGLPSTSVRRHLEDLAALGVVELVGDRPERWRLSEWVREYWSAVASEIDSA